MKRIILFALLMTVALTSYAQTFTPKDTPQLEFVMQLRVTLGQMYSVGDTPRGKRNVIPITGGTFEGPKSRAPSSTEVPTIRCQVPMESVQK